MRISVILSTYNAPDWLAKSLHGYLAQTDRDFEIVIADDGSGSETASLIRDFASRTDISIRHVWQRDDGFRKTRILNKSILRSEGDYLLFSDGDCIPRNDFVAVHRRFAQRGRFLSGGYFKLPMSVSKAITPDDIAAGRVFETRWLRSNGVRKLPYKWWKLSCGPRMEKFLNRATPTRASWNGHNSSGWRSDIEEANGFDERMRYGGEDRELGERLVNKGIDPVQLRYSAICVHLDHARGYVNQEALNVNQRIRAHTRDTGAVRTEFGLNLHAKG
jgi:glycosyltransferase involved in cell wall biosynthesis